MDLEHLTKHQIVLLTLLVSFVTSIATGIVTVSLMGQAPPSISRTINQIVERTVETVAQAPSQPAAAATTEKTIVVKDDDLAAQSIGKVQKAMIRIVDAKNPDTLLARGVIIDNTGLALTDRSALLLSGAESFAALLSSGELVPASLAKDQSTTTGIAVINISVGTSTGFAAAPLADSTKIKLGSSVIRIGGTGADTVGTGVVASLPHEGIIESSVVSSTPGSVLLTMFGEVIGLMTGDSATVAGNFYSVANTPPTPTPKVTKPAN